MKNPRLRIEALALKDIGGFEEIEISFGPKFNFLCGPNGVGKSTILTAIGNAFSASGSTLRRRASASRTGNWKISFLDANGKMTLEDAIKAFLPKESEGTVPSFSSEGGKHLLYLKSQRDFVYANLDTIGRDPASGLQQWSMDAVEGVKHTDVKRWLANRFLFSATPGSLSLHETQDFELAKKCFSLLDPQIKFATVEASTFDVFVDTPQGRIPFEYLSAGYKASLAMLLAIIRQIEVRRLNSSATQFDGVILIDEIELHLHPAWQREIVRVLREAFGQAQFIVTTHSPHIIQSAEPHEIIVLTKDETGKVSLREFQNSDYGFQGWSLEEILRDVMGLDDTASSEFREAMRDFDRAIDSESSADTKRQMGILLEMLHPSNPLRKLIRLQAAPIIDDGGERD